MFIKAILRDEVIELLIKNYDCVNQPSVVQIVVSWVLVDATNVNFHPRSGLFLTKQNWLESTNQVLLQGIDRIFSYRQGQTSRFRSYFIVAY